MKWIPHPYQEITVDALLENPRYMVAARMGMGKTTSIATLLSALQDADGEAPALVLAPKRVAINTWPKEMRKWDHLQHMEVSPIIGTPEERIAALKRDVPIFTMNYDNLPWLIEHLGKSKWPFPRVVADESTKLKGFRGGFRRNKKTGKVYFAPGGGQRSSALARVAHTKASTFIEATGTPSPNGVQDLWGQMWFIDGGERLELSYGRFESRWMHTFPGPDGYDLQKPYPFAMEQVQALIADRCIMLDPKDWFDLRDPVVLPVGVDLPAAARELYTKMEEEFFIQVEAGGNLHDIEAVSAGSKSQKLLQIASGAVYLDPLAEDDNSPRSKAWHEVHDAKIQALESIIGESGGEPILVAYHFRSDLARLLKAFPGSRVLDDDPQTEDDWNAGKIPLMFAHPQSAGHGLNLQDGGRILVLFSHDWNLEYFEQILERLGPMRQLQSGYDRSVLLYLIIARDTMDEVVVARRTGKAAGQQALFDYLKRKRK